VRGSGAITRRFAGERGRQPRRGVDIVDEWQLLDGGAAAHPRPGSLKAATIAGSESSNPKYPAMRTALSRTPWIVIDDQPHVIRAAVPVAPIELIAAMVARRTTAFGWPSTPIKPSSAAGSPRLPRAAAAAAATRLPNLRVLQQSAGGAAIADAAEQFARRRCAPIETPSRAADQRRDGIALRSRRCRRRPPT
jgi:hypothetical protein